MPENQNEDPKDQKNGQGGNGDTGQQTREDDLPQWAKDELARVRREAARYRTERNDLREQVKVAKTPEEYEAAIAEYEEKVKAADIKALRADVARRFNLPDALASRLQGDTEDDLVKDAESLSEFATSGTNAGQRRQQPPADDLKGGLNPNDEPETFDAEEAARKILEQF